MTGTTMHLREVCLCIDDFGLHENVNRAATLLTASGTVHAVSCMVGGPAWPGSLARGASATTPVQLLDVDLGLHLDLTAYPQTLPPMSWPRLWALGRCGVGFGDRWQREIHRQLDLFEEAMGRAPDFVDGHQHVHQFPGIRDALIEVLSGRYPNGRPWVRSTSTSDRTFKPRVISNLGARSLVRGLDAGRIPHNRHLWGVYDFGADDALYRQRLGHWLSRCLDGDLVMCHPSTGPIPQDAIAAARITEFIVLGSGLVQEFATTHHLRLRRMSRILNDR